MVTVESGDLENKIVNLRANYSPDSASLLIDENLPIITIFKASKDSLNKLLNSNSVKMIEVGVVVHTIVGRG